MNKKESLKLSIELCEWLANNPDKNKYDHPTLPVNKWNSNCSLCFYSINITKKENEHAHYCENCPMWRKWVGKFGLECECTDNNSVYLDFGNNYGNYYDREFFARVLLESFMEVLKELQDIGE